MKEIPQGTATKPFVYPNEFKFVKILFCKKIGHYINHSSTVEYIYDIITRSL